MTRTCETCVHGYPWCAWHHAPRPCDDDDDCRESVFWKIECRRHPDHPPTKDRDYWCGEGLWIEPHGDAPDGTRKRLVTHAGVPVAEKT